MLHEAREVWNEWLIISMNVSKILVPLFNLYVCILDTTWSQRTGRELNNFIPSGSSKWGWSLKGFLLFIPTYCRVKPCDTFFRRHFWTSFTFFFNKLSHFCTPAMKCRCTVTQGSLKEQTKNEFNIQFCNGLETYSNSHLCQTLSFCNQHSYLWYSWSKEFLNYKTILCTVGLKYNKCFRLRLKIIVAIQNDDIRFTAWQFPSNHRFSFALSWIFTSRTFNWYKTLLIKMYVRIQSP